MKIKCGNCGNVIVLWEGSELFDLGRFDDIANCCNNPDYWEIDEDGNIVR